MDVTHCKYVGSFGLLKTATHSALIPISDSDIFDIGVYSNIFPGCILHVCPQALPKFVSNVLPNIKVPFKLLTNNSDCTIPDDFQSEASILLENQYLQKWFSQNCTSNDSKFIRIPIGLDYHSLHIDPPRLRILSRRMHYDQQHPFGWGVKKPALFQEEELIQIRNSSRPFWDREIKGYGNFHFHMGMGYAQKDRPDALNNIPKSLMFYEPTKVTRDTCWKHMTECAFVVSPHGNGIDCHRTWEALALGSIPIVKTSGIDPLFDDLPVWIVQDWKDVTFETMKAKIEEFKNRTFNYEKLTLAYWKSKIINT